MNCVRSNHHPIRNGSTSIVSYMLWLNILIFPEDCAVINVF